MRARLLPALLGSLLLLLSPPSLASQVLTSIKPLQLIAAAVLKDIEQPAVLLPPGSSPHQHALRPSERRALQQATRVYWVGGSLELFLESLLSRHPGAQALSELPGIHLRPAMQSLNFQQEQSQGHSHDHGHAHDHGNDDPHLWLSPDNARSIARWMAEDLQGIYPDRKQQLQDNLQVFLQHLDAEEQRLKQRLQGLDNKHWFVFHDGYGYFEDHFNVHPNGIFSLSDEIQPGARHIHLLRQRLQQAGSSCVFSEPQFNPRLIDSLSKGLDVRRGELDPLGVDIAVNAEGYLRLLGHIGDNLADCLQTLP